MSRDLHVLALFKGDECYVYTYTDTNRDALPAVIEAHAHDERLSLNWFDAAILTRSVHEKARAALSEPEA